MISHDVKVSPSKANLKREDQLAWKFAVLAADKVAVPKDVAEMIINRIIDNASVAIASVNRRSVTSARDMALGHARKDGATVFGMPATKRVSPEWAAWANGTAVRELDMHDTFLAADYSHPGDNIPPILAVAQTMEKSGRDLIRGARGGTTGDRFDVLALSALDVLDLFQLTLVHPLPADDQVRQDAQPRDDDHEDHPDRPGTPAQILAPEDVAEDPEEAHEPREEQEDLQQRDQERSVVVEHGSTFR